MNDFKSEPPALRDAMLAAVARVFDSGWYILGEEVVSFEREWARICGTRYAVGVGNGLDAIEIALRTMGIGSGDEVITSPMTAFATVLGIIRAGAIPVLADIESETGLLSIESANRCISRKTKAVILVHLYGQIRNMNAWSDFCSVNKISLIEDCAQAHLAKISEKVAGSYGRVGAYSFYPTKNLGAIGDAGALVTNDSEIAERASRLRNYGQNKRYYHSDLGMNSRIDELQAAILLERLKWIQKFNLRRQQIAKDYYSGIQNQRIKLLSIPEEPTAHVYHLFVITCQKRENLQEYFKNAEVQTLIHYPIPIHYQKPCRNIKCDPKGLKNSEEHAKSCLSIPCHPYMSEEDVFNVIKIINDFKS